MQLYKNKGVTLVESLVAIALVGVALGIMLATFTVGRTVVSTLTPRMIVISKLRETMEGPNYKGAQSFAAIISQAHNNWTIDDRGTPADPTDDIVSTAFFSNVVTINNLRTVRLEMHWQENRGNTVVNLQESLETIIANHWWQ